ncbi:F-box protein At3g07870 [Setaria viridis]|uniref:F-box domain-containing protein n=1 Tax=Setaria viridis TaxID=4556 RepID=A0A4U6VMS5_SETVI|nr:F-box protein At3g07870-like [Setaria viridis]TKW31028.1 hypothetical protein SEVIR_2G078100v2 [Setaria viridis]
MALSPRPRAASGSHAAPALAAGALPEDAIYEILLRLPAKDLCRLRAVCRPWRSLLSDPAFAAAHAARHPEPLIVAGYTSHSVMNDDGILFDIMDQSGRVVRRIRQANNKEGHNERMVLVPTQGDLVCLVQHWCRRSCRLLNPATGAVHVLPEGLAEEHAMHEGKLAYCALAFGQVAATGEYKVLRVFRGYLPHGRELCEVFTLNGGSHGRWRGIRTAPPRNVILNLLNIVTICNGIVYFLSIEHVPGDFMLDDTIAPFNLESEEWMPTIRGPLSSLERAKNNDRSVLSLAVLNGCLVLSQHVVPSSMDMWFLMDVDKGLWVKQHCIQFEFSYWQIMHPVHPLLVLSDGRIVLIHMADRGLLKMYNPRIGTCTDVAEIGPCDEIGLYTGNLLSLANGPSQ